METKSAKITRNRYLDVCERLGFNPAVNFVKILPGGAVGFTCGKPEEVKSLYNSALKNGFRISKGLRRIGEQ